MSSPISIGDMMLLAGFAAKIVNALKDSGSRTQYQTAARQCRNFLNVMDTIKGLDLSQLPDAFRVRLQEYSTDLTTFVEEFKIGIGKYEKALDRRSLRKFSWRLWFGNAPRKLHWAFAAADDLDKFRQVLTGYLDLVKITIQGSLLALLSRRAIQAPNVSGTIDYELGKPGAVGQMTDLIYARLLSKRKRASRSLGLIQDKDPTLDLDAANVPDGTSRRNSPPDCIDEILHNITPADLSLSTKISSQSLVMSALQTTSRITLLIDIISREICNPPREWKQLRVETQQCSQLLRLICTATAGSGTSSTLDNITSTSIEESLRVLNDIKANLEQHRTKGKGLYKRPWSRLDVQTMLEQSRDARSTLSHIRDCSEVQQRHVIQDQIQQLQELSSPTGQTLRINRSLLCARCAAVINSEYQSREELDASSTEDEANAAELP